MKALESSDKTMNDSEFANKHLAEICAVHLFDFTFWYSKGVLAQAANTHKKCDFVK